MKRINQKSAFIIVYISFLVSALSTWLLPMAFDKTDHLSMAGYATGVIFWLGMLVGIVGYILFFGKKYGSPNITKMFQNIPAIVADVVFVLSLAGTIYSAIHFEINQWIAVTALFLLILSLYSHFLFNGKVFQHVYMEMMSSNKGMNKKE